MFSWKEVICFHVENAAGNSMHSQIGTCTVENRSSGARLRAADRPGRSRPLGIIASKTRWLTDRCNREDRGSEIYFDRGTILLSVANRIRSNLEWISRSSALSFKQNHINSLPTFSYNIFTLYFPLACTFFKSFICTKLKFRGKEL